MSGPSGQRDYSTTEHDVRRNPHVFGLTLQPSTDLSAFDEWVPTRPSQRTVDWWNHIYHVQQQFAEILWPGGKKPDTGVDPSAINLHFRPITWPSVDRDFLLSGYWPVTSYGHELGLHQAVSIRHIYVDRRMTYEVTQALLNKLGDFGRVDLENALINLFKLRIEQAMIDGSDREKQIWLLRWEDAKSGD